MRSKAWLTAPVLLAHAEVTKTLYFFQWVRNLGTPRYGGVLIRLFHKVPSTESVHALKELALLPQ